MQESIERLVAAAAEGRESDVAELLRLGVPADGRSTGDFPRTALDMALTGQHVACVRILLAAGADPEQRIGKWSETLPLWRSVFHNRTELVKLLLEAGADANGLVDRKTLAPLALAAENNSQEIAVLLLQHGAVSGNLGQLRSVFDYVAGAGRPTILRLLPQSHTTTKAVSAINYAKERAASHAEGSARRQDYIEVLRMLGDENPADIPPVRPRSRPTLGTGNTGALARHFPTGRTTLGNSSGSGT